MDTLTDTRPSSLHPEPNRLLTGPPSRLRSRASHWNDLLAKKANQVTPVQARWFAALMGVAAVAIVAQAAIAGEFVANSSNAGWILAHGLVSYLTLASTLAAATFTIAKFRRTQRVITALAVGLFALTVVQTVIGYLITVAGMDALLVAHIPLAFVVFGVTGWLSIKASAITAVSHRRFRG